VQQRERSCVFGLNFGDVGLAAFERNFDVNTRTPARRASSKSEDRIHKQHSSAYTGPNEEPPNDTLTGANPTEKSCAIQQTKM
jgi:hypothetical protein